MKRRHFMKTAGLLAAIPAVSSCTASTTEKAASGKQIYEYRVYTLTEDNTDSLDNFFKDTLIPAYNRKNITVGAFANYREEDGALRCLLFVYPDITTYYKVKNEIWDDSVFRNAAQSFFDASATTPVYSKFDTYLAEAFDRMPTLLKPDSSRTLFEMRIYQSPNEEANKRKVKMFNVDEINIFDKVGINSVCYGDILAGPVMPALLYLTWNKDEEARAQAWRAFSSHPDWQSIRGKAEYAHTATNNKSTFLSPMPYSQF